MSFHHTIRSARPSRAFRDRAFGRIHPGSNRYNRALSSFEYKLRSLRDLSNALTDRQQGDRPGRVAGDRVEHSGDRREDDAEHQDGVAADHFSPESVASRASAIARMGWPVRCEAERMRA